MNMHETVSLKILKVWKVRIRTLFHQQQFCGITTEWYQVLEWYQLHDTWIVFQHFRKKGIKAIKNTKPPTSKHHSSQPKQTKKYLFFYAKHGKLEHFPENDQTSLAAVQYANKAHYSLWLVPKCLPPVRGSSSLRLWNPGCSAAPFQSSKQTGI